MTMDIKIRRAIHTDAATIALLARVTFTETFGHLYRDPNDLIEYYDNTFSVAKIQSSLAKSNNVFWLATVDDLPVGYAKLKLNSVSEFLDSDSICQLQKIYVLKDFLAMGLGKQLQNELLNEAQEQGNSNVWLSVLSSNERAISFYTKNDFVPVGEHDFQIGQENFDFIVMNRNFNSI